MDTQGIRKLDAASGRLLAGLVGLTLLAGCTEDEARFASAPEASAGESLQGELTSTSPVNLNNGTRHSAHWLCGGAEAGSYRYTLDAPFAATLAAFDDEGSWLGSAESGPDGEPAILLGAPEAQRCTLVVVNGRGDDAFGPYTLEAEAADDGETLMPGRPLVGRLQDGQAEYAFSLEAPAHLNLALSGVDEGVGMRISGEDVSESAESCAPGELRLDAYLTPGDYRVNLEDGVKTAASATACASHLVSAGGAYQLTAEKRDLSEGHRNGGPLRDGDRITGTLEGAVPNAYTLHLDAPSEVTLGLRSSAFDTVLRVTGGDTDVSNDDNGSGTDSRIQTVLMAGDYRVEVSSYDDSQGDYQLDMRRSDFDGEFRNDGPIAGGEEVRGQFSGVGQNRYRFTVDETSEVNLALDSLDFDPMLHLQGEGVDLSDDDSGGDRNALINTVLEPGDYTLEVQSYSGSGIFTLRAEAAAFEGRMADGGEIAPGDTVYGQLTSGGSLSYRLVLEEARDVVLESTSSAVDTVLSLSGEGVQEQNDDAPGMGVGSRIAKRLQPGSYSVEVRGFGSGVGMVRLAVGE